MSERFWRIVNEHGEKVCDRGTQRECRELLATYVTNPNPPPASRWGRGPYSILRIITTHIVTVRRPKSWPCARASETKGDSNVE